jgi:hypothetical protein
VKRRTSVNESAPASFASVARKVSGWTTNLLATGLILVLALGLGRQLVGWWRIDPNQALPPLPTDQLGPGSTDPTAPYTLEFGDSPFSIDERTVHGDRAKAAGQLLAACRLAAAESSAPTDPPGAAEKKLLETVRLLEPLEVAGEVRFYGPETGFPLLVAVAPAQQGAQLDSPPIGPKSAENLAENAPERSPPAADDVAAAQLGASRDRVLVWGIAASAGDQVWSLYTFRLGQRREAPAAQVPSVSLPPGSHRTMALRDARGETLLGFAGNDVNGGNAHGIDNASGNTADVWRRSFAAELKRTGWQVAEDWQLAGEVWHARYARGEPSQRWTIDVQFGSEPGGPSSGLVRIVPPAAESAPANRTDGEQR